MPFEGTRPQTSRTGITYKEDFRRDIEGLRAVAILLVVAFHANIPGWSGGFIGVDLFFVISGYVITRILFRELGKTGGIDLIRFYARRARRLLPASSLTLVFTIFCGWLLLSPIEQISLSRAALSTALYVSNIWFQRQAWNYFGQDSSENPLLHTWSLSVEEQFYLVWPTLIALTFWCFRSRKTAGAVLLGVTIAAFVACFWLVPAGSPYGGFFSAPARAWQFGIGGLASLIPSTWVGLLGKWSRPLRSIGIATIVAVATLSGSESAFPSAVAVVPVLATAAILISGAASLNRVEGPIGEVQAEEADRKNLSVGGTPRLNGAIRRILSLGEFLECGPMQYIGRRAYAWYLWHWPVLVFASVALPSLSLLSRVGFGAVSLGIAALSYALVEHPIRSSKYLGKWPRVTLCAAAAVTVAGAGLSWVARTSALEGSKKPRQAQIAEARNSLPQALEKSGCFLDFAAAHLPRCEFGEISSPTTIVLFGDSHAAQWFSAFEAVAIQEKWRLIAFTKAGCPTVRVSVRLWTLHQPYPECAVWREAALHRIAELRPAVVIIGNSDGHVTRADGRGSTRLSLQQWRDGTRDTLDVLRVGEIQTVILHDPPSPPFDVLKCLSRAEARHLPVARCAAARSAATSEDVFQAVQQAASRRPEVTLLNFSDCFCDLTSCPPVRNGIIVYRDPGHITDEYARSLAPVIAERLVALVMHGQEFRRWR